MRRRKYFIQQSMMVILASFLWTLLLCVNAVQAQSTADQQEDNRTIYQTESFTIETPADLTGAPVKI